MLIDFRVRPPYKTNLTTSLYNKPAPSPDPTKQSIFLIGKERVPSAEARSISAACSMSSSVAMRTRPRLSGPLHPLRGRQPEPSRTGRGNRTRRRDGFPGRGHRRRMAAPPALP